MSPLRLTKPLPERVEKKLSGSISVRVEEDRYLAFFALSRPKRREFNEMLRDHIDKILMELKE